MGAGCGGVSGCTLPMAETHEKAIVRWSMTDPSAQTISPFSKVTVPEYIDNRTKENTAESLTEAEQLASGNNALLEWISATRKALEEAKLGATAKSAGKE